MLKCLLKPSFRAELSHALILILVIAFAAMLVSISFFTDRYAKERMIRELTVIADILGHQSAAAIFSQDNTQADRNLASARYYKTVDRLCLYSRDGELFSQYINTQVLHAIVPCNEYIRGAGEQSHIQPAQNIVSEDFNSLSIQFGIFDDRELVSIVQIQGNTQSMRSDQAKLLLTLVLSFLLIVTCAYILFQMLLRKTLKPLDSLYDTAKLMANDHFCEKRAHKFKEDEIGALVDVFNKMLDNIALSQSKIIQSEERFRTLAASAPIGIFLMDSDFRRVYVNDRWQEITGMTVDRSHTDYISCIEKKDISRYEQTYQDIVRDRKKGRVEYQFNAEGIETHDITLMEYIAPIEISENDQSLTGFVGSILDVTDLRQARHELEKLAYYDPLTKLPNRRNFRDYLNYHLNRASEEGSFLAVLMLDLDNFKRINDTLGHDAGDRLLMVLADRLRSRLSADDLVARVGGDEFYIVLQDIPSLPLVGRIAKRLIEASCEPVQIKNQMVEVTGSIGVARYPLDAITAEGLMRNVDIALYKAKSDGKNQVAYFSSDLDRELKQKIDMEVKLRKATIEGELELFFQPQYNAHEKSFTWAEVLLRWRDQDEGLISPFKFIPLAEETGLITEIDYWVLKSSCEQWSQHKESMQALGIQGLSINLSARQFYSKHLASMVKSMFSDFDVPPSDICFELTESLVIEDVDTAIKTMKELIELGCQLSLDDFGTGYSSLSYLKKFPINSFKIDKSFISDISMDEGNLAITNAIIAMADKLGLHVVAEGIETEEQKLLLLGQGCYMMQGYYFARPMPLEKLLSGDWLDEGGHKSHKWKGIMGGF